jgi:hypothetical protein
VLTAEITLVDGSDIAVIWVAARGAVAAAAVVEVQVMVALPGVILFEEPGLVKSGVASLEMLA